VTHQKRRATVSAQQLPGAVQDKIAAATERAYRCGRNVTLSTLEEIADALNVSVPDLLTHR
jgi:hypothetical protein